ncbi:MAG: Fpg/Nei family DNA glycosylase [Hamadaea sp.]|uniref:Fpg/Nei family DNA glycosylase n=1 Tax=Hamadaea sp. TaxID=2024425 RepID=UPI0017EE76B9|nr:DNA-formamidopyrimidine glycosylase family protein [Hamadaea sp.]NUR73487.1 Fpg/Nei family DNA glycosylase [Hamadaea sp.]NUT21123.1 Fpg/Nei family DNA glycosylase [Hamadaea sp.]
MPELPEVEALAAFLRERAVGHTVSRIEVSAISALKTFDPPVTAAVGRTVTGAGRRGKFLEIHLGEDLMLVTHLARAGWLHYRETFTSATPLKPGKGPIALRVRLDDGSGFDLTEAGTQKKLAVYLVRDPQSIPQVASLGPEPLGLSLDDFAELVRRQSGQIKGVLRNQRIIAGVGNAYSDEILHVAKLSPFALTGKLTDAQIKALYDAMIDTLTDAMNRSVGQQAATLKGEKKGGLRVHGRTGQPCPICGDTVREVSFADSSLQYCPTCQTGGKPLADRRLSKLLR